MLTPQEIKDIQFDKVMFGGYDMAAVDETMAQITADFSAILKENAVLKNKLKMLASTIEEYRSVDEAMRKALITAQNMANDMVKEAHAKADELIKNASSVANAKVSDLAAQIKTEEERLAKAKAETAIFVDTMSEAYKLQAEKIAKLRPEVSAEETKDSLADTLSLAADEINKCVASAIENMKVFEERAKIEEIPTVSEPADLMTDIQKDVPATASAPVEEKPREVSVFEVTADSEGDTIDLGQLAFDSDANTKKANDFEFENLKFGKNYDFDEE